MSVEMFQIKGGNKDLEPKAIPDWRLDPVPRGNCQSYKTDDIVKY